MPIDLDALKSELTADPLALGYAPLLSAGDDSGLIAILTDRAKGYTALRPIPLLSLLQWSAATGVRGAIENYANAQKLLPADQQTPVYSLCLSIQDSFWGAFASGHVFDLTDPGISGPGGMLDAFVEVGLMTAGLKASLLGVGTVPASRAEVLGLVPYGGGITLDDIAAALRGKS